MDPFKFGWVRKDTVKPLLTTIGPVQNNKLDPPIVNARGDVVIDTHVGNIECVLL